ncbi:MAG: uracil-DNA glycosylase [Robiginitomaculum sp.]|nr:uracil-DNA glycosylase [Robiginitomaculum sp.]
MQDEMERAAESLHQWWADAGVEAEPLPPKPVTPAQPTAQTLTPKPASNLNAEARSAAAACSTLSELYTAISNFNAGALSNGATQAVIARGNPKAEIMLIGEAPGREEDKAGKPFIGRSGQFLDRMLASIGLDETSLYITNGVFWRPTGNRTPDQEETAMCLPFVERHIALIAPKILITVGGSSTKTMLNTETGITKLRGQWASYTIKNPDGSATNTKIPLLPIYHPAFVLRKPIAKRDCWQDLLSLQGALAER